MPHAPNFLFSLLEPILCHATRITLCEPAQQVGQPRSRTIDRGCGRPASSIVIPDRSYFEPFISLSLSLHTQVPCNQTLQCPTDPNRAPSSGPMWLEARDMPRSPHRNPGTQPANLLALDPLRRGWAGGSSQATDWVRIEVD